jgi:hypothetical protein
VAVLSLLSLVTVTLLVPLMLVQLALPVQRTLWMILLLLLLMLFLGAGLVALHGGTISAILSILC